MPVEDFDSVPIVSHMRGALHMSWVDIAADLGWTVRQLERWRERVSFVNPLQAIDHDEAGDKFLHDLMRAYMIDQPNSGLSTLRGYVRSMGYAVTKQRILDMMREIDPVGVQQRRPQPKTPRLVYGVRGPLHLVHIDGNAKLIDWFFTIHGGICGHTHVVVFMEASTNNSAPTVLAKFERGVRRWGIPGRVRLDRGGENYGIVRRMLREGHNLGLHKPVLLGTSTRNQRIEALWNHVNHRVTLVYKEFFQQLNRTFPDRCPRGHGIRFLLAFLFLDRLNADLQRWVALWNHHPMSTMRGHSPLQAMWTNRELMGNFPATCADDYGLDDADDEGSNFPQLELDPLIVPMTRNQYVLFESKVRRLDLDDDRSTWMRHFVYAMNCFDWIKVNIQ